MRPPGLFVPVALVVLVGSAVAGVSVGLMAVLGLANASAKQAGRKAAVVRMLIARVERARR
jgi:hypothetical protein